MDKKTVPKVEKPPEGISEEDFKKNLVGSGTGQDPFTYFDIKSGKSWIWKNKENIWREMVRSQFFCSVILSFS